MNLIMRRAVTGTLAVLCLALGSQAADPEPYDYKVLATTKTSTMEKELNEAAEAGYAFQAVMGGDTAAVGDQAVVVMAKAAGKPAMRRHYKLLATSKTSTMEKELKEAGDEGFRYCGQTVFKSTFGGREVVVILELDAAQPVQRVEYRLQATRKTSTMEKELNEVGAEGFAVVGMTVSKTAFGGDEIVSILQRVAGE